MFAVHLLISIFGHYPNFTLQDSRSDVVHDIISFRCLSCEFPHTAYRIVYKYCTKMLWNFPLFFVHCRFEPISLIKFMFRVGAILLFRLLDGRTRSSTFRHYFWKWSRAVCNFPNGETSQCKCFIVNVCPFLLILARNLISVKLSSLHGPRTNRTLSSENICRDVLYYPHDCYDVQNGPEYVPNIIKAFQFNKITRSNYWRL